MPETSLQRKLHNWQMLLLDLTRANRLLYFKTERGSSVPISAPASPELFQQLVTQGKKLTFPTADEQAIFEKDAEEAPETEIKEAASPQVHQNTPAENSLAANDSRLQADLNVPTTDLPVSVAEPQRAAPTATTTKTRTTTLTSSLSETRLTRALYNLRARARTAAEEQGINVLFVTFGLLHWIDSETKEAVQSPIVLVPVKLEKERGRDAYSIELLEDDVLLNPTLVYKLKTDFNLSLPNLPETFEETGVAAYTEQVRALIARQPGWALTSDVILGVFSFQKINLYQDIAEHEDLYGAHPVIAALAGSATLPPQPSALLATELDDHVPASNSFQVVDADSSQQEAIEAAKAGVSFVMQGPPGTGKSQTITNIIAEMLAAGKRVLFVSQKMAALEVVQRRLTQAGLGEFCLQLHSHKRDKREVVKELIEALDAPDVVLNPDSQTILLELEEARRPLNTYVKALHAPRFALHRSVFEAYGEIARDRAPDRAHQNLPTNLIFDLGDVTRVNAQLLAQRRQLFDRFEAMSDTIDRFAQHPWRGLTLRSISFAQRKQIEQTLNDLIELLPQYADRMKSLAAVCQLRAPASWSEAQPLLDVLKDNDPRLFSLDLDEVQQRFKHDYDNVLRTIRSSYRAELKALDAINRPDDKLDYDEAIALLQQAQAVKQQLAVKPGSAAESKDERIVDVRSFVQGTLTIRDRIDQALSALKEIYGGEWPRLDQQSFDQADFVTAANWLSARRNSLDQLEPYTALLRLSDEASAQGLGSFGKAALTAALPAAQWKDTYWLNFWQSFVDAAAQADEILRRFDSHSRAALIARFRELDRQQLILNRARIRAALSDRRPNNSWVSADSAEAAILRREGAKKRRLKPLRRLLAEIPRLITDVKPCLMMSPLSVATLIDPHVFKFDLVIFDEASQIAPEEAAGAILRGTHVIIGGDTQQLPPTRFFSVIGSDDADATSEEEGRVFESILDESSGLNLPQKMLRWHYRSRDEDLIAFSNHHFYADRLFTFPNVQQDGKELGVEFVPVPEGVYQRGRNLRRNEVEAQRVVDLIFEHAEKEPDQTLGVITFSYAQRDAIVAEWEKRRREKPQCETFFDENATEPFFIKNLEMVQGDERDMIFFSVGYGKDETGKVLMNFGPLNQDGGERRLNVAVTRARCHVKLISSIMPEDIDLTRTQSLGAKLLREYMFYARDGVETLKHSAQRATQPEAETWRERSAAESKDDSTSSPFEDTVYAALTAQGLTLHKQVGTSNYRIDLAVVDPKQPGHYLLGIECDGTMYASAPTARERDRLRQQVLEQLGWKMHRVWSHDWISNQAAEIEKVLARLNEPALMPEVHKDASEPAAKVAVTQVLPTAESYLAPTETPEEVKSLPTYVWPYLYAKLPQYSGNLSKAVPHDLVDDVVKVVGTEGPVHVDLVYARLGAAWNVSRLTAKVKELFAAAIGLVVNEHRIEQRGDFLWPIGLAAPIVRAPKAGDKIRAIEHIASEEIAEAAFLVVQEARSLSEADLISQTAKLLGYARVTKKIDAAIAQAIDGLKTSSRIVEAEGLVRIA